MSKSCNARNEKESGNKPETVTVLGLGNILLSDEGVGVHAASLLRNRYYFSPRVEIIDGGTMGLDLLPFFQDGDRILIMDAVDFGKPPGHIEVVEGDAIPSVLKTKLSVHHIGLSDLLLATKLTRNTPLEICLLGVQPQSLEPGLELTEGIHARMELVIKQAAQKLTEWHISCNTRSSSHTECNIISGVL